MAKSSKSRATRTMLASERHVGVTELMERLGVKTRMTIDAWVSEESSPRSAALASGASAG